MTTNHLDRVMNILMSSEKFSNSQFEYKKNLGIIRGIIKYNIDNSIYDIDIDIDTLSKTSSASNKTKIYFSILNYLEGIQDFSEYMLISNLTEKEVLSKFGKFIKNTNKFHIAFKRKQELIKDVKPLMVKYFKKNYKLDIDFEKNNTYEQSISAFFPMSSKKTKHGSKRTSFNIKTEDINNIKFTVDVRVATSACEYGLSFNYSPENNDITLTGENEYYGTIVNRKGKNDITKIIRREKLKKLNVYK